MRGKIIKSKKEKVEKPKKYEGLSDFFMNAPADEQKKVFIEAAQRANEDQFKIFIEAQMKMDKCH